MITVANAPVSYGVFGLARPDRVPLPSGEELLTVVRESGYDGIDSGEHGLFGTGHALVDNLAAHELQLAGGWVDYPFAAGNDEEFEAALRRARPLLEDFALVARQQTGTAPMPTIADMGDDARRAVPGGAPELELDAQRWAVFVRRVERVASEIRDLGLEPTFHHHATTYIETPREIERLLEDTSVGLTFDSGHLVLGGGDPVPDYERWKTRINHLHLKDVDYSVLHSARGSKNPVRDVWEKRVFVALGEGDVDVDGLMTAIMESGYSGFLVVEQDVVLLNQADVDRAIADQDANRVALRRWIP